MTLCDPLCDHHATVVASLASLPHLDEADTARVRADLARQCPECGRARRLASRSGGRSGGRSDEQTPEVPQEVPEAPRALEAVFVALGHYRGRAHAVPSLARTCPMRPEEDM